MVGTEKRREWKKTTTTPPKPCELDSIKNMQFPSTRKQGGGETKCQRLEEYIEEKLVPAELQSLSTDVRLAVNPPPTVNAEVKTFSPNYVLISSLIHATKCDAMQSKKFVGIRLLDEHSQEQMHVMDSSQLMVLSKQMDRSWKELRELSETCLHWYTPTRSKAAKTMQIVTVSLVPISMKLQRLKIKDNSNESESGDKSDLLMTKKTRVSI